MATILIDLGLAAIPFGVGLAATWRLIWPKWKILGKLVAYFSIVALLSHFIGHWSLAFAFAHQTLGLVFHIWFSRKHGFTWYAVEDVDRYVALSKKMVGVEPGAEG